MVDEGGVMVSVDECGCVKPTTI